MSNIKSEQGGLEVNVNELQYRVQEQCVLLNLTITAFGTQRKVSSSRITVDGRDDQQPDQSRIKTKKKMLECPELDNIYAFDAETRAYVRRMCLSSRVLKGGVYMLPNALIGPVIDTLEYRQQAREQLLERMAEAYPVRKEEDRRWLGVTYEERNYPTVDKFLCYFRMSYVILAYDTPASLKGVRERIFELERQKAQQMWMDAYQDARKQLVSEMRDLVGAIQERLTPGPDGKPKVFRDSMVVKLIDWLRVFDPKNDVVNFPELQALVERARSVIVPGGKPLPPGSVSGGSDIALQVSTAFGEVVQELDGMVVNAPSRRVLLDDEEAA